MPDTITAYHVNLITREGFSKTMEVGKDLFYGGTIVVPRMVRVSSAVRLDPMSEPLPAMYFECDLSSIRRTLDESGLVVEENYYADFKEK